MSDAFVIGLLGAESTGKTTLAAELGRALAAGGRRVAVVPEYLREFCDRSGRTPRKRPLPASRPAASRWPPRRTTSSSPTPPR